jgi:Activator of Hsp90 ATPase homolog 1-like protein
MATQTIEAIRKSVTVALPASRAFVVFTDEISTWWPLASHSYGGEKTTKAVFEPREGGRVYEVQADGTQADWATVTEWDPPNGFVLDWKICPSTVEVRFVERNGSTRVELEHRGWERAGDGAEAMRANYDGGWDFVLGQLVGKAA